MLKAFSNWLYRISGGWLPLLGIILFVGFTSLVLPAQAERAESYAGGAGSPDSSFFYTPDELYRFAETYGESGRMDYIRARFTFDLLWPVVYAFFLATTLSWVFLRTASPASRWRLLNLAPVLGMVFDYLENVAASLVMWRFPGTTPILDWLAPVFSMAKWFFIAASFVLLLAGLLVGAGRWARKRFYGGSNTNSPPTN